MTRLLGREDVEVARSRRPAVWPERPTRSRSTSTRVDVAEPDDPAWLEQWHAADRDIARRLDALLAAEAELTPYEVAGAVSRALPAEGLLFVGASSPIRDLDLMARPYRSASGAR